MPYETFRRAVDRVQCWWPVTARIDALPLKDNPQEVRGKDFLSLLALFAPALLFGLGAGLLWHSDARFAWLASPGEYPWELWALILFGTVATLGGVGDWAFHRLFVAAGPQERKSHMLALGTGGFPLAVLMAWASVGSHPMQLLIPIQLVVLYTTALICYDEFVFHRKRCKRLETLMHRLLVFGNGAAWLAWMHWIYVRGGVGAQ